MLLCSQPIAARAQEITSTISIFILDTDERGTPTGLWTGETLTGSVTFSMAEGTDVLDHSENVIGTNYSASAIDLTLPSGTILSLSTFGSVTVYVPVDPIDDFYFVLDGDASGPDPLATGIQFIEFTFSNSLYNGLRYFDDDNYGGGLFSNGYYGSLSIGACGAHLDVCDDNAICTDTLEEYTCTCKTGYTGDGVTCIQDEDDEVDDDCDDCTETESDSDTEADTATVSKKKSASSGCSATGNLNGLSVLILVGMLAREMRRCV